MNFKKIALTISLTLMLLISYPIADAMAANAQTQCNILRAGILPSTGAQFRAVPVRVVMFSRPAVQAPGNVLTPAPQPAPRPTPQPAPQPVPQPTPQPAPQPAPPATGQAIHQLSESELLMINLVNQERQKAGVAALRIDTELSRVARIKSEDMMANGYFSHTSPTYGSPFQMMRTFGISFRSAGENIARSSSVNNAHNGLMNSEGHRRNILNPGFTHIGVGIAGGRYFTQMFISR